MMTVLSIVAGVVMLVGSVTAITTGQHEQSQDHKEQVTHFVTE